MLHCCLFARDQANLITRLSTHKFIISKCTGGVARTRTRTEARGERPKQKK